MTATTDGPTDGSLARADGGRLPNFLIAGVPKCGTTSLAAHLTSHPDVFMTAQKELHFFDWHFGNGTDWYRRQFALAGDAVAVGEATPTYVLVEHHFERVVHTVPDVRLVLMVRHPVDRAYSHFWFNKWRDPRNFETAIEEELSGVDSTWGYVRDGRYIEIAERVLRLVTEDRLHVVLLDDLQRDPAGTVEGVLRFLGVRGQSEPLGLENVHNQAFRFRSHWLLYAMMGLRLWERAPRVARAIDRWNRVPLRPQPMPSEVRRRLLGHYEGPNQRFGEWLGRDLTRWSQ